MRAEGGAEASTASVPMVKHALQPVGMPAAAAWQTQASVPQDCAELCTKNLFSMVHAAQQAWRVQS